MTRVLDAVFGFLMRPRVRRLRRWAFVVTIPLAILLVRWRGIETGVAVFAVELLVGATILVLLLRQGGERREAVLDLLMHPTARRITATEIEVLTTLPRAFRRRRPDELRVPYARRSQELGWALALTPAILVETVVAHLLLPFPAGLVLTVLSLYGWLWLVSMAAGMRTLPHLVRSGELLVRFGPLYRARIPLADVASWQRESVLVPGRMGLHILDDDVAALLVAGQADFRIDLRRPVLLRRPFGAPLPVRALIIPADHPDQLEKILEKQVNRKEQNVSH